MPDDSRKAGVVAGSRRWIFIAKHYVWTSIRSPRWLFKSTLTIIQLITLAGPILHSNLPTGEIVLRVLILFGAQGLKLRKLEQPKSRQIVERNYDQRKLALYRLIHQMSEREMMLPPQVATYQRDALALIAAYVRDHRADWKSPTIFANLLIEDGDDLIVVARDQDHRHARARYPKENMLAQRAFATGLPQLTGDICRDFPTTPRSKPYRSVIAIPVHRHGEVIAVVSVDSAQEFHFDLNGSQLVNHLRPYIALLAWTLPNGRKRLYLPSGER